MGIGIWSMHFVGMLAFPPVIPVRCDVGMALLSLAASVAACYMAFSITSPERLGRLRFAFGGLWMGSGLFVTHVTGMAVLRADSLLRYDPIYWTLSAVVALAASFAAMQLFIRFRADPHVKWWKGLSAVVTGLGICGMYDTGILASRFLNGDAAAAAQRGFAEPNVFPLYGVALTVLFILIALWVTLLYDRRVLEKLAYSDSLTGLPNRHEMDRFFDRRSGKLSGAAVLFIDLDRFKTINDTLGHDVGDLLVQQVGRRLQTFLDDKCRVFRIGGDEYLVVREDCPPSESRELAERILHAINVPYLLRENELNITASIGISLSPEHGTDRFALLKAADTAMYNAKSTGKNKICVFDDVMDKHLVRRMELEKDLHKAMKLHEFFVVYQPKWNARTDRPVGFEALIRWKHPKLGVVSPDEFLPIAEETGLAVPMTRWMLTEACRQNLRWIRAGLMRLPVSVNLSAGVFQSRSLIVMVRRALDETGLPPELLELEVAESKVLYDLEEIIEQFTELRSMGVRISMDNFGSGLSSLGALDRIPLDTLKIDQLFVREIGSASKRTVVRAIVVMASQLKLDVVAEGVERKEEIEALSSIGCELMQGYYYGKPMERLDMEAWLKEHSQARRFSL